MEDEILGDDDMVLAGDDEIIGLDEVLAADDYIGDDLASMLAGDSRSRGRGRSLAQKIALARRLGGAVVAPRRGAMIREQVLPVSSAGTIAAGVTSDITTTPQRKFRPERFVVSSGIALYFTISNINIGQDPQFIAAGIVPATIFSEVGVGVRLKGKTANLGNTIVVTVTNTDAAPRQFLGAIIGSAVD